MKSTCPVVVNGRVEGELSAPELDVTATGTVQGNIKAERLSSRGMLSGNIDAGDLFLSGSVGNKTVIKAFKTVDGAPWPDAPFLQEDGQTYSPFVVLDVPA